MSLRAITLALLVVLAGCAGVVQEETPTPTTTSAVETTTSATEATAATTEVGETTEGTTTEAPPENPWRSETVTVAVRNGVNQSRDVTPLVDETLAYWNEHADEYGDYSVEFVSTPNARGADVTVELVPRISECGDHDAESTVGCAALLESGTVADRPERVAVVAGYTNDSTREILRHEFGHLLGIEHGEEPMPTMKALSKHTYLSQPDATSRTLPWRSSDLSVYVDGRNWTTLERRHAREQVEHALQYYEDGAEGHVPANVTFELTENESAANVVISWPDSLPCTSRGDHSGSCGNIWGYSTDADEALEYYSTLSIRLGRVDHEAIGWHVGYWLASGFGLTDDELPPPWVDPDYETSHGEWWEA